MPWRGPKANEVLGGSGQGLSAGEWAARGCPLGTCTSAALPGCSSSSVALCVCRGGVGAGWGRKVALPWACHPQHFFSAMAEGNLGCGPGASTHQLLPSQ